MLTVDFLDVVDGYYAKEQADALMEPADFMQKKAPKHQKYSPMLRGYDPLCSFAPVCYGSLQKFCAKLCPIKGT